MSVLLQLSHTPTVHKAIPYHKHSMYLIQDVHFTVHTVSIVEIVVM